MDVFAVVAGAASILGLGFSAWAIVEVRALRQRYVRQGTMPQLLRHLDEHGSELTSLLESGEVDQERLASCVALPKATLARVERVADRGNKKGAASVLSRIVSSQPIQHRDQIRRIRTEVYGLSHSLNITSEADQWT